MVTKNLQTHLRKDLIAQPIRTFKDLFDAGIQVEDAIHAGDLDKGETSSAKPRRFGGPISESSFYPFPEPSSLRLVPANAVL